MSITARNPYGRSWTDDGDGGLELPVGRYDFCVEHDGLRVEGSVVVSADISLTVKLPGETWLKLDAFRLSSSYGADTNEEHRFADDEFTLNEWNDREIMVPVLDLFQGAVYAYAEFDSSLLSGTPSLTAIYTMAHSGEHMEKNQAFGSMTSGAYEVLAKGAVGNTVIYRVSTEKTDGYTYSQDYKVLFTRIPTLTGITVLDQKERPCPSFLTRL